MQEAQLQAEDTLQIIMAKINITVPEPKEQYEPSNQRQIIEAIDTLKNQLNFSFQFDLKEEQDSFNWFMS